MKIEAGSIMRMTSRRDEWRAAVHEAAKPRHGDGWNRTEQRLKEWPHGKERQTATRALVGRDRAYLRNSEQFFQAPCNIIGKFAVQIQENSLLMYDKTYHIRDISQINGPAIK